MIGFSKPPKPRMSAAVPVVVGLVTWLVWEFGVMGYLFDRSWGVRLTGISVALNAALILALIRTRRGRR